MRLSVLSRNRREEIIPMRCGFNRGGGAVRFCVHDPYRPIPSVPAPQKKKAGRASLTSNFTTTTVVGRI